MGRIRTALCQPEGYRPSTSAATSGQARSQAQIGTVDTGYYLTSSTLYLVTNCTSNGVSGPGQITGNPISSSNPTGQQLTQNYPVQFHEQPAGPVHLRSLPGTECRNALDSQRLHAFDCGDDPLDPTTFPVHVSLTGTSFATANCLIHTGELFNGSPACELYTLTCQVGTNPSQSGALCPASTVRNEIFQESFRWSQLYPSRYYRHGRPDLPSRGRFPGGQRRMGRVDPAFSIQHPSIAHQLCPQNVLTSFSGPGAYKSGGPGQSSNSTFITVAPVPEDLTTVTVSPASNPGTGLIPIPPTVNFVSTPPAVASNNNFVAAPIQSLTYGISSHLSVPQPPVADPRRHNAHQRCLPCPGSSSPDGYRLHARHRKVSASLRTASTCCITSPRTAPAPKS